MVRFVGELDRLWFEVGEKERVFLRVEDSCCTGWVVRRLLLMLKLVFLDL
jgi:hypothetical protein